MLASLMQSRRPQEANMFLILALVLGVAWIFGFAVMKVSAVVFHLLVLFAVVSVVAHGLARRVRKRARLG